MSDLIEQNVGNIISLSPRGRVSPVKFSLRKKFRASLRNCTRDIRRSVVRTIKGCWLKNNTWYINIHLIYLDSILYFIMYTYIASRHLKMSPSMIIKILHNEKVRAKVDVYLIDAWPVLRDVTWRCVNSNQWIRSIYIVQCIYKLRVVRSIRWRHKLIGICLLSSLYLSLSPFFSISHPLPHYFSSSNPLFLSLITFSLSLPPSSLTTSLSFSSLHWIHPISFSLFLSSFLF